MDAPLGPTSGSKRRARKRAAEARRVATFQRELEAIQALAPQIAHEAELRLLLQDIPDLAMREEVCKLLEPFLTFSLSRVTES